MDSCGMKSQILHMSWSQLKSAIRNSWDEMKKILRQEYQLEVQEDEDIDIGIIEQRGIRNTSGWKQQTNSLSQTFKVNMFTLEPMDLDGHLTFKHIIRLIDYLTHTPGLQMSQVISRIFVSCLLHTIALDGLMIIATRWEVEC